MVVTAGGTEARSSPARVSRRAEKAHLGPAGVASRTAVNAAFDVLFALFVVLLVGLAVTAVRWALRRDRLARAEKDSQETSDRTQSSAPAAAQRHRRK